jgi:hypothetical protein
VSERRLLDRREILDAFEALSARLAARGVRGNVFVVGGAAMILAYGIRRATRDVDAVFEPKLEVYAAAADVAPGLGLPPDWLNDAVKGFLPGEDEASIPVFEGVGLQVSAASARYLLGLKLLAARPEQDADDIRALYQVLKLKTAEAGLALVRDMYPDARIPPKTRFMLEEMFPDKR